MSTKNFILLLLSFWLGGCVGDVQNSSKQDNSVFKKNIGNFNYIGAINAVAESQKKIRVYFPSYSGGNVDYAVYINGNFLIPAATVSHNALNLNPNGLLSVVIDGLNAASKYEITVRVRDASDSTIEDANTNSVSATTFTQPMPTFNGLLGLENFAGIDGLTKIRAFWNEALPTSLPIAGHMIYYKKKTDVVFQTIRIEDPSAREGTISGLVKNTDYIFNVRAFDNQNREEENYEYASLMTLDDTLVIFPGISAATVPTNDTGFGNILVEWPKAIGPVVKYRIFWKESLDPNPILASLNFIDITDLKAVSRLVAVPNRNTNYQFVVLGCLDLPACATYNSASALNIKSATTTPPVAPFAGLSEVRFGIDYAILSWITMPDSALGAFDAFQVSKIETNNTETLIIGTGAPLIATYPVAKSATSVKVEGLIEGEKYCFKVKSTIVDPGPVYRNAGNASVVCGIPQYVRPGQIQWVMTTIPDPESTNPLDTIQTACYSPTKDGFTVKWKAPIGEGTFSSFAIYVEEGPSATYTSTPVYMNKTVGDPTYIFNFTGLNPDTQYAVGIRTYFSQNTIQKFGASSVIQTCKTNLEPVVPQGWSGIMSLGSKTDGLNNNEIIPEAFIPKGDFILNQGIATEAPFTMPVDFNKIQNYFGWEPVGSKISTYDSRGMIRLAWKDFKYQDGGNFSLSSNSTSLGYNVYRMDYKHSVHASSRPGKNLTSWGLPRNTTPLKAKNVITTQGTQAIVEFYDYDFSDGVTDLSKVYWYKVEPVASGNHVQLLSTAPDTDYKDYVVKVILPSKNVSLIHRWMANRETCERMGRQALIDRNKQYRCPYDGIASKAYPTGSYYDVGGHILMDRFELSCNMSRNKCNNTETKKGAWQCVGAACSYIPYEAANGDCVGTGTLPTALSTNDPNTLSLAGAVYYNRKKWDTTSCSIHQGGSWKDLNSASLTPAQAAPAVTNAANLPPLTRLTQTRMGLLCAQKSITLQLDTTNTKVISKRLQRKQEFVLASAPPEDSPNHYTYTNGDNDLGCNIKWAKGSSLTVYQGMLYANLSPNDAVQIVRGPSATGSNFSKHNGGLHGQKMNQLDLRNFRYPTTTMPDAMDYSGLSQADFSIIHGNWPMPERGSKSGPVFAGGSQGIDSTMLCLSRYGIQDMIGNVPEWSSDRFYCTNMDNCVPATTTTEDTQNRTWSYLSKKSEVYDMKFSGSSMGLPLRNYFGPINALTFPVSPTLNKTWFNHFLKSTSDPNAFQSADFISVPLGLPVSCQGGKCLKTPSTFDDNASVATGLPNPFSLIYGFNYEGDFARASVFYDLQSSAFNANDGTVAKYLSFILGGFPCSARSENGYNEYLLLPGNLDVTKHACLDDKFAPGRNSFNLTVTETALNDLGGRCSTIAAEDEEGNFTIP